jgi:hypothetical protein
MEEYFIRLNKFMINNHYLCKLALIFENGYLILCYYFGGYFNKYIR